MQPLRSLGRRRRPEISSPLLLSFRASKTSLLVSFYSVYRLLCYLPSLNSFHEILFCGIRMANSGLLKTSSCLVVSGKPYKNLTFFLPLPIRIGVVCCGSKLVCLWYFGGPLCRVYHGIPCHSWGPRYCFAECIREYSAWDNFHSKQNPFLCLVSAFLHLFLSPFQTISFNNSFQFIYM